MDLAKEFKTDDKKMIEGVWVKVGDGTELLVAANNNPRMTAKYRQLTRPYRNMIIRGTLAEDVQTEILCEVFSTTILLNWRGLKDEGVDVDYSPEAAKQLLLKYKAFRDLVADLAGDQALYRTEVEGAEEAK